MDLAGLNGPLIGLAGAFLLQIFLVPWLETKKRRVQRWEDDVHALGELLAFDLPRAVRALTHELSVMAILQATFERTRPDWFERMEDPLAKAKAASAELSGLRVRVDWLKSRVGSLAPDHPQSKDFVRRCDLLSVQLISLTALEWKAEPRPEVDERLTVEEVDDARRGIDASVDTVLDAVATFGTSAPLRNPLRKAALRVAGPRSKPANDVA